MNRYCFVIPCYQHAKTLNVLLTEISSFQFPIIIINDGSDPQNSDLIKLVAKDFKNTEIIHHQNNMGKGAAVISGLKFASQKKLTHAIQIDSDGQHDVLKIKELISLSQEHPDSLISGRPVYDSSIPKSRLWGRYITHFWVWLETLSFKIKDSMCGFRVYPLEKTYEVLNSENIGNRMDFDTQIMVELFWNNTQVLFIPVKVTYPPDGISNFNVFSDNILISKMHAKLFFKMFYKLPRLYLKKLQT